jgi:hypothetical protein
VKRDRRDHKQVHRRDTVSMVAKNRLPSLGRRSLPPGHIFGNRRLPDLDTELEEFAMNPWGTPEWVGDVDFSDQPSNF